jgi:flagella basal body P-ring formation protein FlgA
LRIARRAKVVNGIYKIVFVVMGLLYFCLDSIASESLQSQLKNKLESNYPGARIVFNSAPRWSEDANLKSVIGVHITSENGRGLATFTAQFEDQSFDEGSISFSAFTPAWVAKKRVKPGDILGAEVLTLSELDVATGLAREYRGVLLAKSANINDLEARQTILEGQFALSTGVQQIPEVRRGDAVSIRLKSGEVTLNTQGTTDEPAYLDKDVRVTVTKGKRQLIGKLRKDKIIEVQL